MLCVIAKLPPEATHRLSDIKDAAAALCNRAPSTLYGHITIAACTSENEDTFIDVCSDTICQFRSFIVRYEKIEVLPQTSIIVALPAKYGELLSLHDAISEQFGDVLDCWTRGGNWQPHTTLLYDPYADLPSICRQVQCRFTPFETIIQRIEFSRVNASGYSIVQGIDL